MFFLSSSNYSNPKKPPGMRRSFWTIGIRGNTKVLKKDSGFTIVPSTESKKSPTNRSQTTKNEC